MNPKDNRVICIVNYVTQFSIKCFIAQKISKKGNQAFSSLKVIVRLDNLKSLLVNNKSNPHKQVVSNKSLLNSKSDISIIYSPELIRKVFHKCKQDTNNTNTAQKQSKKIKTNTKLPKKISKSIKLYLLRNDNLVV